MFPPIYFLYGLFALAALALLINIRFKLPKKIFLFLVVSIVVATCWVAMNLSRESVDMEIRTDSRRVVTSLIAEDVILSSGCNEFPLAYVGFAQSCKGATYSLNFGAEQGRESDILKYSAELCTSDKESIACDGVYRTAEGLKYVFVFPPEFDFKKIVFLRINCKESEPLRVKSISEDRVF